MVLARTPFSLDALDILARAVVTSRHRRSRSASGPRRPAGDSHAADAASFGAGVTDALASNPVGVLANTPASAIDSMHILGVIAYIKATTILDGSPGSSSSGGGGSGLSAGRTFDLLLVLDDDHGTAEAAAHAPGKSPSGDESHPAGPPLVPLDDTALAALFGFGIVVAEPPAEWRELFFWLRPPPDDHVGTHVDVDDLERHRKATDEAMRALFGMCCAHGDGRDVCVSLPGLDATYVGAVLGISRRTVWGGAVLYPILELDASGLQRLVKLFGADVGERGRRFADPKTGDELVVDTLCESDFDAIKSGTKVDYPDNYLHLLLSPPLNMLSCAIRPARAVASTGGSEKVTGALPPLPAMAWCSAHTDFSLGLLATDPAHRRKGLARICAAGVTTKLAVLATALARPGDTGAEELFLLLGGRVSVAAAVEAAAGAADLLALRPHCFIAPENVASFELMRGLGFRDSPGSPRATWIGVVPRLPE
ncbi:hypothetical protein HK405_014728 [Cladochytrium tenue]|nr:hypothetical protein HK405_014728 [Cladochytrium tenue]